MPEAARLLLLGCSIWATTATTCIEIGVGDDEQEDESSHIWVFVIKGRGGRLLVICRTYSSFEQFAAAYVYSKETTLERADF